jgi:acetyl esterase/lipase
MTFHPAPNLFHAEAISAETRASNDALARRLAKLPTLTDFVEARRRFASGEGPIPSTPKSKDAKTLSIPGKAGGKIGLRIIAPEAPKGVYLHIHGGGWALGSADMRDGHLEQIAAHTGLACVSVEYRLAPEHPYPAGPDDCETAARWLVDNASTAFGVNKLVIGGESAGAHLSVITLLRLREAGLGGSFCCANLVFGPYDLSMTPSTLQADGALVIDRQTLKRTRAAFLPAGVDRRDPDVSPLYADLRGLPAALFTIGTLDPLLDDSLFMHARWIAAGNAAELAVYPGGVHGFTAFGGELAQQANAQCERFFREAIGAD